MHRNRKKVLSIISFCIILLGSLLPSVYAGEPIVLSDKELDEISAEGLDIDINYVSAYRSAVAAQSNIGAISALNSSNSSITNTNNATLTNIGDSAVAAQSNIGAVVAKTGDINEATIKNTNTSDINNTYSGSGGAQLNSLYYNGPYSSSEINYTFSNGSAVAAQNNIAVIAALDGGAFDSSIDNLNQANLSSLGNSAVATQRNIAVVIAQNDINAATINNDNIADVTNTYNTVTKDVQAYSFSYNGILVNVNINKVLANQSAIASQCNIDVVGSLAGNVSGSSINNSNIATVHNLP